MLLALLLCSIPARAEVPLPEQAAAALAAATRFFRTEVAVQGSYLWTYSEDLKTRRGEGEATATQGWVQPPGTPSVGTAYLRAYEATGDRTYLDAARETAHALAQTQLASGGWDYRIEFDPEKRGQWHYRRDIERGDAERRGRRNTSTFDDNTSQSALLFLMRVDTALQRKDPEIRRAVQYGLAKLREAQYPNGAWPQRYDGEARDRSRFPVQRARYPASWPRTHPGASYQAFYTFNDGAIRDLILTLLEAHRIYRKPEYLAAARKGGDFILLAQMPEPQPVWAQQYSLQMEPAWARRFEPPSVVAAESAGVVRTLLDLYRYTGDEKYLKPVAPAIAWFRRSRLPDGRWARFYELRTNRPLYFTRQYELVYSADNLPTHYSFQGEYGIPRVIAEWEGVQRERAERRRTPAVTRRRGRSFRRRREPEAGGATGRRTESDVAVLEPRVRETIAALDARGRWVEAGTIRSATFIRNVESLAAYLAAMRSGKR
jgi:hypothetical protein